MARILVVDDDPAFRGFVEGVLKKEGHSTATASGSGEALEVIARERPELIVLDVIMDSMLDGLSVVRELDGHPDFGDVPIVMVTSIANSDYAQLLPTDACLQIDAFLTKPMTADRLVQAVNRLLA